MAKYPELCQGNCLLFMGENYYRGIHKLVMNSCPTPPPPPFYPWECSEFSLLNVGASKFTFYHLCKVKILIITTDFI